MSSTNSKQDADIDGNAENPDTWSSQEQKDGEDEVNSGGGGEQESSTSSKIDEAESTRSSSRSSNDPSPDGTSPSSKSSSPHPRSYYYYTREELMKLKDAPLSIIWPSCLDPSFNKSAGRWDPDRWIRAVHDERRPSSTASAGSTVTNNRTDRPPDLELKARSTRDPRERVKQEEQDGLVLSPQRRSFSTGCHGLQQGSSTSNRPDSPLERSHTQRESHREIPARRIGSGRISRRDDVDVPVVGERRDIGRRDRDLDRDRDTEQRRDSRDWRAKPEQRFDRDDRFDNRRRFFEEDEPEPKRPNHRERERRYQDRKRTPSRAEEEEQPEWFTGGPTSQNEFIELVGFDDIPEEGNTTSKPQSKRERRRSKKDREGGGSRKSSRSGTPVVVEELYDNEKPTKQEKQQQLQLDDQQLKSNADIQPPPHQWSNPTVVEPANDQETPAFNIDEFLEDIIGFQGAPDDIAGGMGGSSKLKQFFSKRESPVLGSTSNSRRSSVDLPSHFNNLLNGLDSNRFFAPISPADKTVGSSIVDLLQRASGGMGAPDPIGPPPTVCPPGAPGTQPPSIKDLMMDGKGQSLEEVEAGIRNMRQQASLNHLGHMNRSNHATNQMTAFNDFLSQVNTQGVMRAEEKLHSKENILMKLLNGGMKENNSGVMKPAVPSAPLENDLIAMLIKGNGGSPGHQQTPLSLSQQSRNMPPPAIPNLSVPPPNLVTPSQPPPNMHQLSPQAPPTQDVIMKFLQAQQQQQQQQKRQLMQQALQQQQQQQQLDPIKQLMGGLSRMSVSPSPQPQDALLRDALLRPDVQSLLQRVASGHVTAGQLVNQLKCGNGTPAQREAIATVLKFLKGQHTPQIMPHRTTLTPSPTPQAVVSGGLTLGGSNSLSPRVASPNPDTSNMLSPHILQQQSRLSPLMFAGSSIGSNLSINSVGGGPRRPPSHQELVAHTQNIMQKALLKQELEKAKEKHRKREAERARSPNPNVAANPSAGGPNANKDGSPSKTGKSQSPLVFTPTSVMRKMTADRDRQERTDKSDSPVIIGDMKDGDRNREQLEKQLNALQLQNPMQQQVLGRGKVDKRDIRRGTSPLPPGGPMIPGKGPMMMGSGTPGMINMGPHSVGPPGQRHPSVPYQPPSLAMSRGTQQNLNIRAMQAQAALAQQLMRSQAPPGGNLGPPHHRMPSANPSAPLHQLLLNNNTPVTSMHHHHKPDGGLQVPIMSMGGGSHRSSPVNLATFFGRDIIAQVQVGGLAVPELPSGKVMSLEEVERLQQTQAVPN